MKRWLSGTRLLTTPGGQPLYSNVAIETSLLLRAAFKLPLRQTEGLMGSVFQLLNVDLAVPDHSTVSRRAMTLPSISPGHLPDGPLLVLIDSTGLKVHGAGEWLTEKHGARVHRSWRKLHLAVDANNNMIVASILTEKEVDDPSQVLPLLDQFSGEITQVTADGAYDGEPTYQVIAARSADITVVIPPRATAVPSENADTSPTQRDRHIASIAQRGRLGWQEHTGYGHRALVETAMGRYKAIIGPRLRSRCLASQRTEAAIGVAVLNRMLAAGHPRSVRSRRTAT
jgi:hypothetical protein